MLLSERSIAIINIIVRLGRSGYEGQVYEFYSIMNVSNLNSNLVR